MQQRNLQVSIWKSVVSKFIIKLCLSINIKIFFDRVFPYTNNYTLMVQIRRDKLYASNILEYYQISKLTKFHQSQLAQE